MLFGKRLGVAEVGDREGRDISLVDVRKGDPSAVAAPPQAVEAVELLGGRILGQAVGTPSACVIGDAVRLAAG